MVSRAKGKDAPPRPLSLMLWLQSKVVSMGDGGDAILCSPRHRIHLKLSWGSCPMKGENICRAVDIDRSQSQWLQLLLTASSEEGLGCIWIKDLNVHSSTTQKDFRKKSFLFFLSERKPNFSAFLIRKLRNGKSCAMVTQQQWHMLALSHYLLNTGSMLVRGMGRNFF